MNMDIKKKKKKKKKKKRKTNSNKILNLAILFKNSTESHFEISTKFFGLIKKCSDWKKKNFQKNSPGAWLDSNLTDKKEIEKQREKREKAKK